MANLFRAEVVRHVRKHQDRYENHVRGGKEAFPAFCDNALKQTHWICGLLLQAAAEVKSCCIVVWNQKDEVLERFTFAPEWSPQGMPRMKKEAPILVVYRNDKHYQSVRPPQDQDGMTKVPKHWARETAKPEAEALGGAGPGVGESPKTLHTLSPGSSHAPSLHTLPASSFRGSSGGVGRSRARRPCTPWFLPRLLLRVCARLCTAMRRVVVLRVPLRDPSLRAPPLFLPWLPPLTPANLRVLPSNPSSCSIRVKRLQDHSKDAGSSKAVVTQGLKT